MEKWNGINVRKAQQQPLLDNTQRKKMRVFFNFSHWLMFDVFPVANSYI